MNTILCILVMYIADGPSEATRTTLEKLRHAGHLRVSSCGSVGHTSKCGTVLVAVGRHRTPETIGATSLHVGLEAHVFTVVLDVQCFGHMNYTSCVSHVDYRHVLVCHDTSRVLTIQIVLHATIAPNTASGPSEALRGPRDHF